MTARHISALFIAYLHRATRRCSSHRIVVPRSTPLRPVSCGKAALLDATFIDLPAPRTMSRLPSCRRLALMSPLNAAQLTTTFLATSYCYSTQRLTRRI